MPLSFEEFRGTKTRCPSLSKKLKMPKSSFQSNVGFVYDSDCYIEIFDNGLYHLSLPLDQVTSSDLEALEKRLYEEWYLPETQETLLPTPAQVAEPKMTDRELHNLMMAMEFGYKACEKGHNIEMARIKFNELMGG